MFISIFQFLSVFESKYGGFQFRINIINKSILDSGESIENLIDDTISIYEDFMIHLSETQPLTTISIEENYRNINIYRAGRGRSELETYFAIFC